MDWLSQDLIWIAPAIGAFLIVALRSGCGAGRSPGYSGLADCDARSS
jgi:hypothetical protein